MKNLKFLGVLLVGLFMPILVNADTAVIKDIDALKACVETSNICEIKANIEVKDIDFNKGHIRIAKDYKLIIAGNTKVSTAATLEAIGNIHVLSGAVLDATEMSYGETGLIASQPGKLVMENGATFKALDF